MKILYKSLFNVVIEMSYEKAQNIAVEKRKSLGFNKHNKSADKNIAIINNRFLNYTFTWEELD